jgi:hypothetical protein
VIEEFMRVAKDVDVGALSLHPELVNIRHEGATALHVAAIEGQLKQRAGCWNTELRSIPATMSSE